MLAAMETKGHKYEVNSKSTTGNPCWKKHFSFLYKKRMILEVQQWGKAGKVHKGDANRSLRES